MHQYDVWLDLECAVAAKREVVCSVFARREFPVHPIVGESITFWSAKDSLVSFNVVTVSGARPQHYVSTEVDNLAHHFHPSQSVMLASTFLRCSSVEVATIEDARKVVEFLCAQHDFELDPYGPNGLGADSFS